MKRRRDIIGVLVFLVAFGVGSAWAQAVDFVVDLDTPAAESSHSYPQVPLEVEPRMSWSAGFFGRSPFQAGPRFRWGLKVGQRSLDVSWNDGGLKRRNYSEFRTEGRAAYDIAKFSGMTLSGELDIGFSFMNEPEPCDAIFCDLPDMVIIATPGIRGTIRLFTSFSLVGELKYSAYLTDSWTTYPFKSGFVVGLGFEIGI